jgi:hypothetical protein
MPADGAVRGWPSVRPCHLSQNKAARAACTADSCHRCCNTNSKGCCRQLLSSRCKPDIVCSTPYDQHRCPLSEQQQGAATGREQREGGGEQQGDGEQQGGEGEGAERAPSAGQQQAGRARRRSAAVAAAGLKQQIAAWSRCKAV